MLVQRPEAETRHSERTRKIWGDLITVVIGIVSSVLAGLVMDFKTLPAIKPILLITASYIGVPVLTIVIAYFVTSKRNAETRLKANLRAAYMSALTRSPLNPEREAVEHGR